MIPVERNEVDLKPLFNWFKEFEIRSEDEEVLSKVYMRILGDADLNKTRVYALRRSAELRAKLRNTESDERLAYIPPQNEMNQEQLANLVIVLSMRTITQEASKNMKIKLPKAPKADASLEKQEKYQAEIDDYPKIREKAIRKSIEKEIEKIRSSIDNLSIEDLYARYTNLMITELCEQELNIAFKEMCAYNGSYKDEGLKQRYFDTLDEFMNLPPDIKGQFMAAYQSLDLYGDDLKKSLHPTH